MIYDNLKQKSIPHTKKHPLLFFPHSKKRKKKKEKKMSTEQQQQPASSPPANRLYVGNIPWSTTVEELQALFADATSVEIPTVRVFVVVFCRCGGRYFFIPRVWSLSFGGHKARFAEKSDDMMAIKIEIAPIHSMTKKTTMMDSRIQSSRRRKHATPRRRTTLSLSLDGRRRRKRRKSKVGGKGRHVSSRRWLLYHWWGNKKGPPWCELSPSSSLKVPKKRKKSP